MKIYFHEKTLIIESENYTENFALQVWGEGFFKKVDYNVDVETNPYFLLIQPYPAKFIAKENFDGKD